MKRSVCKRSKNNYACHHEGLKNAGNCAGIFHGQDVKRLLYFYRMEISNRKAYHDYFFETKYIAGIALRGTEVKSLRSGKASFNDSYCYFVKGELYVKSLHISEYAYGTYNNHEPMQERKLLLNRRELKKLEAKSNEKGYSIIPLKIFLTEKGIFKMEIGLGKGKKNYDKRETIKERESDRDIKRRYGM